MPFKKCVESLTEICIHFILVNQDFFLKRFTTEELENGVDYLDSDKAVVNPFDELPNELLERLLRLVKKQSRDLYVFKGFFEYEYKITPFFKLLITPRLRTLDLHRIKNDNDISNVLHLATIKSPHLETLCFDVFSLKRKLKSYNFISKFVKLRVLVIHIEEIDDDCFDLIGKHCPDLRELLCRCNQVTDDGIRKLCVVGNCKSIFKLSLESCRKITTNGIKMALDNLPQLRVLDNEFLVDCLTEIAQTAIDQKLTFPKYSLSTLLLRPKYCLRESNSYAGYKTGNLQKAVLLCPNTTRLRLSLEGVKRFDNTELLSLLLLKNLISIEIFDAEYESINNIPFDKGLTFDGIVPLLKQFGKHLKRLELGGFCGVDLPAIINFCPYLEYFSIFNCKMAQSTETYIKRPVLQNLKVLSIRYKCTISTEFLFLLLSSPSLSKISIRYCDCLTDDLLQRVAACHSFINIDSMYLYKCNSLTKNGIDVLLQETNPLRKIELTNNREIRNEDIKNWNENAIWVKKNWQFNLFVKKEGFGTDDKVRVGGNKNLV